MLEYLAALILLGHGIGHVTGVMESWTSTKAGFKDEPWLFGGGHKMRSPIGRAFGVVWMICVVMFVISSIGILMGERWWRTFALVGAVVSLAATISWWKTVMTGVKAGAVLNLGIILTLLIPAGEELTDFFELP